MAQIDVSDILSDPDFVSPICFISRKPFIDNLGQNQVKESEFKTIGCVQPASGKTLTRLPEALRVADVSSFWFKGTIDANTPGKYPSIIVFNGRRYTVQIVFDWSNFGAGYTEGTCVAEKPS